ncbi:hypothetical protein GCM10010401_14040 [Rarobacter faecitabidus]|uniref:ParB/RepB/Spo0J family partition protein n=2 Tax=Rarobacter faecitabidus TaxID=13243 RepID=A0A542ZE30_RARFA|nr:ParB/RepB/Spo0J family partition protein [Rarobacter faecitabidus]TQL58551.1 ParB/RepB/Spo0J family partition protein [Rarobacter faecitabidus]
MAATLIPVGALVPDPKNVRGNAGADLDELTASVAAVGVLQPVLVRPAGTAGTYMIVDGHRRFAAAKAAGLSEVPALFCKPASAGLATEVMLAAAMHKQLEPVERAQAFQRLVNAGLTIQKIAARTGYSVATVRDSLSLMTLPTEARRMIRDGEITATTGVELAKQVRQPGDAGAPAVATTRRKPPQWFSRTHQLAKELTCTHAGRSRVGGVACGECWEDAIRADERARAEA